MMLSSSSRSRNKEISMDTDLILRKNKQTVHLFESSRAKKCFCGSTDRSTFSRNHVKSEASVADVLDADRPADAGVLGKKFAERGLASLKRKVNFE